MVPGVGEPTAGATGFGDDAPEPWSVALAYGRGVCGSAPSLARQVMWMEAGRNNRREASADIALSGIPRPSVRRTRWAVAAKLHRRASLWVWAAIPAMVRPQPRRQRNRGAWGVAAGRSGERRAAPGHAALPGDAPFFPLLARLAAMHTRVRVLRRHQVRLAPGCDLANVRPVGAHQTNHCLVARQATQLASGVAAHPDGIDPHGVVKILSQSYLPRSG